MQHSVKGIGENYEALSTMRNEKIKFNAEEFFKFAQNNLKKYSIVDNGIDVQMTVVAKGAEYWNRVRMWAKQHRLVTGDEDKLLGVAAKLSVGMMPDAKQCRKLLVVKDRVEKEGFLG